MVLLHTGKLLIWGNTYDAVTGGTYSFVAQYWDPALGGTANRTLKETPHESTEWINMDCSGMVVKANGKALLVGGADHNCNPPPGTCPYVGHRAVYLFDPDRFEAASDDSTGWSRTWDMNSRRYYPTATGLPDARVLAVSGERQPLAQSETLEVYYDGALPEPHWKLIESAHKGFPEMNKYYPMIHVIPGPSRRILSVGRDLATGTNKMHLLDLDAAIPAWGVSAVAAGFRAANPVMYSGDKILRSAEPRGSDPPEPDQEIVTLQNGDVSSVTAASPLATGRIEFNSVVLPDGNVLVIGGGTEAVGVPTGEVQRKENAIFRTELYKPPVGTGAGETCKVAWMRHRDPDQGGPEIGPPRMYHSTSALLPGGEVIVAGGDVQDGCPNPDGFLPGDKHCISADYYKPSYLFTTAGLPISPGDRPTLTAVPAKVAVGETFEVDLTFGSSATAITSVCLIRPAATTHALDMEQRRIPLAFTTPAGKLRITAPADLNQAPPGYYMLFAMNDGDNGGHPSVGQFVQLYGIHPSTMKEQVTQNCGHGSSSLIFQVSFETPIATTGLDSLLLYSPGGNCGALPALVYTALAPTTSTLHTITTPALGCLNGNWRYQVRSGIGTSRARSVCKTIPVGCASCCDPPCEFE